MMDLDARRSSRSKKEINYSAFGGGEDDDDGDFTDFTDPTPPPAKKPRAKEKGKKTTKKRKKSHDSDEDYSEFKETARGKRKERRPLEDRMFDRELELVLEMSKQDSSQETNDDDDEFTTKSKKRAREVSAVVHAPSLMSDGEENKVPRKNDSPQISLPSDDSEKLPEIFLSSNKQEDDPSDETPPVLTKEAKSPAAKTKDVDIQSPVRKAKETKTTGAKAKDLKSPVRKAKDTKASALKAKDVKSAASKTKDTKTPVTKPLATPGVRRAPLLSKTGVGAVKKASPALSKSTSSSSMSSTKSATPMSSPRTVALKRPTMPSPAGSGNNPLGGVKLVSPGAPMRLGLSKFARIKPLHNV